MAGLICMFCKGSESIFEKKNHKDCAVKTGKIANGLLSLNTVQDRQTFKDLKAWCSAVSLSS